MKSTALKVRVLKGFDDPALGSREWERLLREGPTNTVFLTHGFQSSWWQCFGRGKLILLLAERSGHAAAVAPLFCDGGMVFFVGSGGADYLDFVGRVDDGVLEVLLSAARELAIDFAGFRFYHVPEASSTTIALQQAIRKLGLVLFEEGQLPAPRLNLLGRDSLQNAVSKTSLVRHEKRLLRKGVLEFFHTSHAGEVLPWLDAFFEQHFARWATTPYPSLFLDPAQRRFYRALVAIGSQEGWLRFSRLTWNGTPVAFHFGFHFAREFLWYKPSFDIELAKLSPGEVMLSRLLRASAAEEAAVFDFGIGDEAFKHRFASSVPRVGTWGVYPRGA